MRSCGARQSPSRVPQAHPPLSPPLCLVHASSHLTPLKTACESRRSLQACPPAVFPRASSALAAPPALACHPFHSVLHTRAQQPVGADEMVAARVCWTGRPLPAAPSPSSGHKMASCSAPNPASRHTGLQPPVHPVTLAAGVQTNATTREIHGELQQPQCTSERLGTATAQKSMSQPVPSASMRRHCIDAVVCPASATADDQLHQTPPIPAPETRYQCLLSEAADVMLWPLAENNVCQHRYGPALGD